MIDSVRRNYADHDPEMYEKVRLTRGGNPCCPVCDSPMRRASNCESNNMWVCNNRDKTEGGVLECTFIEGKFSKRHKLLWDCRYEPSLIDFGE